MVLSKPKPQHLYCDCNSRCQKQDQGGKWAKCQEKKGKKKKRGLKKLRTKSDRRGKAGQMNDTQLTDEEIETQ